MRCRNMMLEKADKVEQLLKQAAKVLASKYQLCDHGFDSHEQRNKLKFIQLSQVDEEQIIAVIVLGGNVIKNKIIDVGEELKQ